MMAGSQKPAGRDGVIWWRGMPVPATAAWSAEIGDGWVGHCSLAGQPALMMPERQGQGEPLFKNPHPVRQRRAMLHGLCDVCARPLRYRTKILAGAIRSGARGLPAAATNEPLVCRPCYVLAARYCPHVRGVAASGTQAGDGPWIVSRYHLALQILELPGMIEIAERVDDRGHTSAGCYFKLVPTKLRPMSANLARRAA